MDILIRFANIGESQLKVVDFITEKSVESSWIIDLRYSRKTKILTMTLSNNKAFQIIGVTRTLFDKWVASPSKGRFFHLNIKPRFGIKRIR